MTNLFIQGGGYVEIALTAPPPSLFPLERQMRPALLLALAALATTARARSLTQLLGSGLGGGGGGLLGGGGGGGLVGMGGGWGWGRAFSTPLSPLAGNQANVYCDAGGDPPPPKSLLFICYRQPTAGGGVVGDIIPRFGDPVCVNLCKSAGPGGGCGPCSDPALICAREYGGGGGYGTIYTVDAAGASPALCPTPGVDGGRVMAGTVPLT